MPQGDIGGDSNGFGGRQTGLHLTEQRPDGNDEHGGFMLQDIGEHGLTLTGAHMLPVADDDHVGELRGAVGPQELQCLRYVLQVHAKVEQFLACGEHEYVVEGIQASRPRTVRCGDRWLHDMLMRPVVELPVCDAGRP